MSSSPTNLNMASTTSGGNDSSAGSGTDGAVGGGGSNNRLPVAPGVGGGGGGGGVNAGGRSVSEQSFSSEGSNGSHVVDTAEMRALTNDVKHFKEALSRLRKVFNPDSDSSETVRVACHERLSEVLKILRTMLEKYPLLQTNDLVQSASYLIRQVKDFSHEEEDVDEKEFHHALDTLALAFSNRVSEYLTGDLDSASSTTSSKEHPGRNRIVAKPFVLPDLGEMPGTLGVRPTSSEGDNPDVLTPEQIDALLLKDFQGVDHALKCAKKWAKYAKDVNTYVEKKINLELEWARGLTKLAQTMRPILKEESHLPFQSIYCTALDLDLEMCASTQATCSLLQGFKFMEPLFQRRSEHVKMRKTLKDRWTKELKKMQDTTLNLRKARHLYIERNKEYERCREAVRIAEQGAEVGAMGENKVDKRKRLEEEAMQKTVESENVYRNCVTEANERHRQLLDVKADILQQIRELIFQCDQTMKAVTVSYFQLQHTLTAPLPEQAQELCEKARLYEPGSQYMEYVRGRVADNSSNAGMSATNDPFNFEPYSEENSSAYYDKRKSLDHSIASGGSGGGGVGGEEMGTYRFRGERGTGGGSAPAGGSGVTMMAWPRSTTEGDPPSDSDSESRESSPPASPVNSRRMTQQHADDGDNDPSTSGSGGRGGEANESSAQTGAPRQSLTLSLAARSVFLAKVLVGASLTKFKFLFRTHRFRKLKTPSRCRDCDTYVFVAGVDCTECGLSAHKKCLEGLALQCGHKRLPRKMTTFGVDLGQHLLESGSHIPPLVCKCVHEINKRGIRVKGIYRVCAVKHKVEKLCQAFEQAPDLVELTDIQPNVIANVLKLYMRQLPEPLITFVLYPEFIRVVKGYPTNAPEDPAKEEEVIQELSELTKRLPRHHLRTLAFLMHHLNRVSRESEVNNMPASNLAIVFGPTLMRTSEGSASLSSLVDTDHQTRAVELLTVHASAIFGPPESVLPRDFTVAAARYTSNRSASIVTTADHHHSMMKGAKNKHHKDSAASVAGDIITMGHIAIDDFIPGSLPGHVSNEANEEYLSEEDGDDAEAIPSCWLPDDSAKTKKSPLLLRGTSSPPKIIKASLKSFSGLEGVTPERLSTQDSLESGRLSKQPSSEVPASSQAMPRKSIPQESTLPSSSSAAGNSTASSRGHRASETLLSKVGIKATKKHSLDEDYHNLPSQQHQPPPTSSSANPVHLTTSDPDSQHAKSNDIYGASDKGSSSAASASSAGGPRSSSLSDEHSSTSVAEQRRRFLASTSCNVSEGGQAQHSLPPSAMSTSLPSTIPNIEENRVKIQVPGGMSNAAATRPHPQVVKQSSVNKGETPSDCERSVSQLVHVCSLTDEA